MSKYLRNAAIYSYLADKTEKKSIILEPIWKVILYSNAFLPYLASVFPEEPNILPSQIVHKKKKQEFLKLAASNKNYEWASEAVSFGTNQRTADDPTSSLQK